MTNQNEINITELRICTKCTKYMVQGYVDEILSTYYCTEECLDASVSEAEQEESFNDESLYWTDWLDDTTVYVIFDNQYVSRDDAEFIQTNFGNPTDQIKIIDYDLRKPVFTIKDRKQLEVEELS